MENEIRDIVRSNTIIKIGDYIRTDNFHIQKTEEGTLVYINGEKFMVTGEKRLRVKSLGQARKPRLSQNSPEKTTSVVKNHAKSDDFYELTDFDWIDGPETEYVQSVTAKKLNK